VKNKVIYEALPTMIFKPETQQEQEELDEFADLLANAPVSILTQMIARETEQWKIVLLAGQIMDDMIDYIEMEK
jgi:hypothetical protein